MHPADRTPHVVIIEHTSSIRSLFRELLSEEPYRVTVLGERPVGADEIARLVPNVIVHDYSTMEELADLASLQCLATDPRTCHIPMIVCSTSPDVETIAEQLGGARVTVVPKPFLLDDILRAIEAGTQSHMPLYQERARLPESDANA